MSERLCSIEGCGKKTNRGAMGWCDMHYQRQRRHGGLGPVGMLRAPYCPRLSKDENGAPYCVHGKMISWGRGFICSEKSRLKDAVRAERKTNLSVLNDSLSRRLCFPQIDRLFNKHEKALHLQNGTEGGEWIAASNGVDRLYARLEAELSNVLGGTEWLHSRIISVEMPSMRPVTTSLLQLAA